MNQDSEKSAPPSSPNPKGFKDFFRRKHKLSGSGSAFEGDDGEMDSGQVSLKTPKSKDDNSGMCEPAPQSYGNYLTVSGTGAKYLRDLFNKNYRSSARSAQNDGESRQRKISQSQMQPLFRFRSKKDSIREEKSPTPEGDGSSVRSDSKGSKDYFRNRHTSGPVYAASIDSGGGTKTFLQSRSSTSGARMKTFFDSFRQRSKPLPTDLTQEDATSAESQSNVKPSKKKKKFKVTPAYQEPQIGPDEFVKMYRNRANSDPKISDKIKAQNRTLSTSPPFSRANTIHAHEQLHLVIWKDRKKGNRAFWLPKKYTDNLDFEDNGEIIDSEDLLCARFLNSHRCYDAMPTSTKLVVFDTQLSVKKAFFALVQNGVRSAPLWNAVEQDFVGMLTITDFIHILQKYYNTSKFKMEEVEDQKIATWGETLREYNRPMVYVDPDTALLDAVRSLQTNKVHRLLVVEPVTGNALHILTHKRILRYLYYSYIKITPHLNIMQRTVDELGIGSYKNVAVATYDMPLIQALNVFVERRISALPVVDASGRVVDIYAKFDVFALAAEKLYSNLDVSLGEAVKNRKEEFEGFQMCMMTETLSDIIERIVETGDLSRVWTAASQQHEVHRLIVVKENRELEGIISLSDLLNFLVLDPFDKHKDRLAEQEREKRLLEELEKMKLEEYEAHLLQEKSVIEMSENLNESTLQFEDPLESTDDGDKNQTVPTEEWTGLETEEAILDEDEEIDDENSGFGEKAATELGTEILCLGV